MTQDHAEAPISVSFKAGTAQYAPLITVRADSADQLLERLVALNPGITEGLNDDAPITDSVAVFQAAFVETWALAAKALEGVSVANGGGASAATGQSTTAEGRKTETDKFDNVFEFDHPKAPATPHGPAVLKTWKQRDGKVRKSWVDPRTTPSGYGTYGTIADDDKAFGKWGKDAEKDLK